MIPQILQNISFRKYAACCGYHRFCTIFSFRLSAGKMLVVGEGLAGLEITQIFYTSFRVLNHERWLNVTNANKADFQALFRGYFGAKIN